MDENYDKMLKTRDISGNKNGFYGKKHSDKTKLKIINSKKGSIPPNRVSVSIDGTVYSNITDACKKSGLSCYKLKKRLENDNYPNIL